MEQDSIYDQLNFAGSFGAGVAETNAFLGGNEFLKGLVVPVYLCPSSSLDWFPQTYITSTGTTASFNNPGRGLGIQYVGIQGAAPAFAWTQDGYRDCGQGWSCNQGSMRVNQCTGIRDVSDGTTQTIMIAEQSGTVRGTNLTSNYYGGWSGARQNTTIADTTCTDHWQTGTTCIRQPPNSNIDDAGNRVPYRNNTTINSFHSGGVTVLLVDGSVQFISDNIDFQNLKRLAIRNDGQKLGEY